MRKLVAIAAVVVLIGLGTAWVVTIPGTIPANALGAHTPDLANGETMFNAGGCAECHAALDQPDKRQLGGGLSITSPFGTFYVPNISPDAKNGIGDWTEAQFVTALLKGTSEHGRHLYPAFPYTSYQHMRLDDARDLFAFIKTLPPASNRAPHHELRFPFNIRRTLGVWKLLFLDGEPFKPDPSKSDEWNRGAYLVNGPGHCAECHSPRNALGGIVAGKRFSGGANPDGQGWIPNITQRGLSDWSEQDIAAMLETGHTPDGDSVGGSMTAVVRGTSKLSAADRAAMAAYIKSLPAVEGLHVAQKK